MLKSINIVLQDGTVVIIHKIVFMKFNINFMIL